MLCQSCKKNEATTHVKRIVNGQIEEYDLCHECAKKMGYTNLFSGFENEWNSLLGSFFGGGLPSKTSATRCKSCGSSFSEIAKRGIVGCPDCYDTFYDELLPSIRKIHGNTQHNGKFPASAGKQLAIVNELESLQEQLNEAVSRQEFEKAAQLRDRRNSLKGGNQNV